MIRKILQVIFYIGLFFTFYGSCSCSFAAETDVEAKFEAAYAKWSEKCRDPKFAYSSSIQPRNYPEFTEITKLGMKVVPLIVKKIKNNPGLKRGDLWVAIQRITKRKFNEELLASLQQNANTSSSEIYVNWWAKAPDITNEQFYGYRYYLLKNKDNKEEFDKILDKIYNLGVLALPFLVEEVKQGNTYYIPIISKLSDNELMAKATQAETIAWWKKSSEKYAYPVDYAFSKGPRLYNMDVFLILDKVINPSGLTLDELFNKPMLKQK